MNPLIYGKNDLDRIVCIEPGDTQAEVFRELKDGSVERTHVPCSHFIIYTEKHSDKMKRLKGEQPYRWLYEAPSRAKYADILSKSYKQGWDFFTVRDPKEALMVRDGYTYFKGMKIDELSVLSFDIETTGLKHDSTAQVLLISNTFRRNGKVTRKLFSVDEYPADGAMIDAWCAWVREMNPSVILGHNIFGFDLPYISHCSANGLNLGRDGSALAFSERSSVFRKDGSQSYDYNNAHVYGREIVDTFFLSIKYDQANRREYENYKLKDIIRHEKLEKKDRQHYDAGEIAKKWSDPEERKKIKKYAEHDADDALALFDLMIPSVFYYTQSVPRSFQQIVNSATGSQINSLMVRSYLQQGHSIARGSDSVEYEGAISFGVPGIHKNVLRFDVASLYPSVMRQYKIYNPHKDPQALFLELVETFTLERLKNKKLGKETGDRYYEDLANSQKIAINSMYGFLGAPKLNYNYPKGAAEVTRHGREILKRAIKWATGKDYVEQTN